MIFLEELSFIGNQLHSARVTREQLLDVSIPAPNPLSLTNGILNELENFRKDEGFPSSWLHEAVESLTCEQFDIKIFTKDITKILSECKKKSKNQSRDGCQLPNVLLKYAHSKPPDTLETLYDSTDNPKKWFWKGSETSFESSNSQAVQLRKLRGDIESLQKTLTAEKVTRHTLQQLVKEKNLEDCIINRKQKC